MSSSNSVCARVLAVRARGDGSYAVTLAPGGRHLVWFVTKRAVRYGQLVEIEPRFVHRRRLGSGVVTVLEGGALRVVREQYARRVVPAAWLERVRGAVRRPLYAYQAEGAGWMAERLARGSGSVLADEPGLGKTVQTLSAVAATRLWPAIIVCPASAKGGWQREARYLRGAMRLHGVEGLSGPLPPAHGYVLNYDLLRDRETQLATLGARVIVFDEAHTIKEPRPPAAHRAAVATRLARRIGAAVMLTGTPLLNRVSEWWRLLHLADRRAWPDYQAFRDRYCAPPALDDPEPGVSLVTDHGEVYRVDELRTLTDAVVLRRLKGGLLAALPPKRRRTVVVQLEAADRRHYDAAEQNVVEWLRRVRSHAAGAAASKNEALVRLTMLRRIAAIGKVRAALPRYLKDWFEQQRQPLVIFAFHQDVVAGIHQICRLLGLRRSGITGKSSATERTAAVDAFTMGEADVFIAPVRAAGTAINLQSAAHCLFVERLWTPSLMSQAEDRLHRIGQSREVEVTYLDAERTVDQYVAAVLAAKQRVIDRVVDDVSAADAAREAAETAEAVADRMAAPSD